MMTGVSQYGAAATPEACKPAVMMKEEPATRPTGLCAPRSLLLGEFLCFLAVVWVVGVAVVVSVVREVVVRLGCRLDIGR